MAKIQSLFVGEVAGCKKSLLARFKICSLLIAIIHSSPVAKFPCYLLEKLLVVIITCYSLQKLLIDKILSLLVAKFARYSFQKLLVAEKYLPLVAEFARYSLKKLLIAKFDCYLLHSVTKKCQYLNEFESVL